MARRTVITTAATVIAAVVLTACDRSQDPGTATAQADANAQVGPTGPRTPRLGYSNGKTYVVNPTSLNGSTPDLRGTWRATRQQLSGGDPAVAEAFNGASHGVVRGQIARALDGVDEGSSPWDFESAGQVTFRDIVIAQVITGTLYWGSKTTSFVGTVVIDTRTAKPVTFAGLFANERAGLERLSKQTKIIVPKANGWAGMVMPDVPGNAPTAANFANWIPTVDGMEIFFPDNQFGIAPAQTITVPWRELVDVLSPRMAGLAKGR